MYPLNDKDLDRLSRDAADQYDVEASASGWEHLENRLNKELPLEEEKDKKRFLLWLFFIALVSGGALTYMLTDQPANEITRQKVSSTQQQDKATENTDLKSTETVTGNTTANNKKKAIPAGNDEAVVPATDIKTNQPVTAGDKKQDIARTDAITQKTIEKVNGNNIDYSTTDKTSAANNKIAGKKNAPSDKKQKTGKGKQVIAADNTNKLKTGNKKETIAIADNNKQEAANPTGKNNTTAEEKTVTAKTKEAGTETTDQPIAVANEKATVVDSAATEQTVTETVAGNKKTAPAKGNKTIAPFEIGFITGPDFSNVNFKYAYKTGINLGLYLGYRFSDRLSVNSGLIYTKKFYKAGGEDFHPPKHTWLSYQDIQMVQGNCSMFEIPLNIRYDVAVLKQSRFFINGGVANYLINGEYYDCDYKNSSGTRLNYKWSRDSAQSYLFSALNLSVGYEQNLNKHISIQAEPYLKVPFKGMGYGNINLGSYGVFVTLKYKPWVKGK